MNANDKTRRLSLEGVDVSTGSAFGSGVQRVDHAARQRVGKLTKLGTDGRVWVEIEAATGGRFCVECIAPGPLGKEDIGSELVVWLHARGVGLVLGREPVPSLGARLAAKVVSLFGGTPRAKGR